MPRTNPPAQAWWRPATWAVSVLISLIACLALTSPALGNDYPPGQPAPSIKRTVVAPGGTLGVRFPGFCARQPVTIWLERGGREQRLAQVIANGAGVASVIVRIPQGTASGGYLVVARGLAGDCVHVKVSSVGSKVDSPSTGALSPSSGSGSGASLPLTGGLPFTGLELGMLLVGAVVLAAAGLLLRRLSRSRTG